MRKKVHNKDTKYKDYVIDEPDVDGHTTTSYNKPPVDPDTAPKRKKYFGTTEDILHEDHFS